MRTQPPFPAPCAGRIPRPRPASGETARRIPLQQAPAALPPFFLDRARAAEAYPPGPLQFKASPFFFYRREGRQVRTFLQPRGYVGDSTSNQNGETSSQDSKWSGPSPGKHYD